VGRDDVRLENQRLMFTPEQRLRVSASGLTVFVLFLSQREIWRFGTFFVPAV
jgi:hypothetical protein